jgi:hypothetical protein
VKWSSAAAPCTTPAQTCPYTLGREKGWLSKSHTHLCLQPQGSLQLAHNLLLLKKLHLMVSRCTLLFKLLQLLLFQLGREESMKHEGGRDSVEGLDSRLRTSASILRSKRVLSFSACFGRPCINMESGRGVMHSLSPHDRVKFAYRPCYKSLERPDASLQGLPFRRGTRGVLCSPLLGTSLLPLHTPECVRHCSG